MVKLTLYILTVTIFSLFSVFATANENNGFIIKQSNYSVTETINRLENILTKKGITIFARISHDKNAKNVGLQLRPTELLIFGNPKLGTHFFTANQTAGIDLPMKALAWQDENGAVWLGYNSPKYIAKRHNITNRENIVIKMTNALNAFTTKATTK